MAPEELAIDAHGDQQGDAGQRSSAQAMALNWLANKDALNPPAWSAAAVRDGILLLRVQGEIVGDMQCADGIHPGGDGGRQQAVQPCGYALPR